MLFWTLAIVMTLAACAALYYASAARPVNAAAAGDGAMEGHFRRQFKEIDEDLAGGRLLAGEAGAARAEIAREVVRQRREAGARAAAPAMPSFVVPLSLLGVAVVAFAAYAALGRPDLPSQPIASRPDAAAANISVDQAVTAVEARLAANPNDLRGWQVIAPIYMQSGAYAKAEHAFRQILALSPPTADSETDLAEALIMEGNGTTGPEALDLLNKAAALDPRHVRSRFYLASAATQAGRYAEAVNDWNAVIALGTEADAWMPAAKTGLAAAEAGRDGQPLPAAGAAPADAGTTAGVAQPAVLAMVKGLSDRLTAQGGSLAEWTQLVRSEIVLGDLARAQSAYDAARKAYPDAGDRAELDGLAAQAGLKIDGSAP